MKTIDLKTKTTRVYHVNRLTKDEVDHLNAHDWGSAGPRFTRYLDVTTGHGDNFVEQARTAWKSREYHLVAIVRGDDLDDAFRLTNHIEHDWRENENVESFDDKPRSTSVGDIMIDTNGRAHIVAPVGFVEIDLCATPDHLSCGACSCAIGAHTRDENCADFPEHWFVSFGLGWATGATLSGAVEKLGRAFRDDFKRMIRASKKDGAAGAYVWAARVGVDADEPFRIEFFQPVGVPIIEAHHLAVTRVTLKHGVEYHIDTTIA